MELYILRHGERIDETAAKRTWRSETRRSRQFDPPLTCRGAEQARLAGRTLLELIAADAMEGALPQPYIFAGVYISPKMRCLATAQAACGEMERLLLLQEQGGNAVVSPENLAVVPGLSECAAHVRRQGAAWP